MYRLPAEFEKQKATIFLFPYRNDIWRDNARPIQETIVKLANIVIQYQPVILGILPELKDYLLKEFSLDPKVQILEVKYNDAWPRDSISSVIVGDNDSYISAFHFNAYGGKLYSPWDDDEKLDLAISKLFNYEIKQYPLTLEGGNFLPDGKGTLFAVKDSIFNDNRNPNMSFEEIESILLEATCSKQIIWFERGLAEDETGGHIDNLISLADPTTILLSWTDDKESIQYDIVREAEAVLKKARNLNGEAFKIIKLPIPPLHIRTIEESENIKETDSFSRKEDMLVLETYVNIVLANDVIVVPQYNIPLDKEALDIIAKAFPDRDIVPLYGREASLGGGGFHCLSKHIQ